MKVAVIGCTHAGTAAIINTAKLYPDAEITVYERNDNISFLSCGIALYVGGVIKDPQGLFYSSPEELAKLGVDTKMKHDVLDVDVDSKKLKVRNLDTNEEFEDTFDKLIITTGSWPIIPKLEGIDLENVLLSKNFYHSNTIIEKAKDAKNIIVVGAGYIGVELVEAFEMNGKNVTLIDAEDRILSKYLDKEFTDVAEKAFTDHSVKLALGELVTKFEGEDGKVKKVITDKGEYETDLVIMCIGFRPNTGLFKDQVDMLGNGAIIVDEYMRTSKKDVFAAGDSCAVIYNPTGEHRYIPLATNAVRMGTLAARNLVEPTTRYMGTQGTSGIKIYEHNIASTGLTENAAKASGLDVKTVTVKDNDRPEFMPTYDEATLKLVYEKDSKRILGAQINSKTDLTQSINTMSVVLQNKMTIDELAFVDFFFQPHFNKPWNLLNLAGLSAE
ncbi:FAD-dependent oxidoreductase [Wukongibacter baidiensis]|uniref:FAD-dependent oxidoreductase n=1 Tax=Wukongibacter baidiensis TaxID=1723361 RepID=UPI003D7F2AD9